MVGPGHVRAHWPTCAWVNVTRAAANQVTIVAAGGAEAIIQGMQGHVGVAGVQEHGARALVKLTANNGALVHRVCCRCVVCVVRCMAGWWWWVCILFVWHHLPAAHV